MKKGFKLFDKTVDHDFLIKKFCASVIKQLYARHALGTDYRHRISVTIARFREFEKNPELRITKSEIEKYLTDLYGLQEPKNKPDDYGLDNWMFTTVYDILWDIAEYYEKPQNKPAQEKLENDIRDYFIGVSSNLFDSMFYRFVPMPRMVSVLKQRQR